VDLAETLALPVLADDLARVEAALQAAVHTEDPFLTEVATHLIAAGGKRIRPTLGLLMAYAAGSWPAPEGVVTGAVAVELVHLGSLYHDDVIDEASTRRSQPSVNARWGNIVAILAGDYLLARASELAASLGVEVAGLLAATIAELCKGQVLELQRLFDITRDEPAYFASIGGKTAALMATSCRIGALVARLDRQAVDALTAFGGHLGIVYQIVDDVLDITGSEASLGKPAGNDLVQGVYTLPVIGALRASAGLRDLLGRPLDAEQVARVRGLVGPTHTAAALEVARARGVEAEAVLDGIPGLAPEAKASLVALTRSLLARTS
jgi:heptaprenyl diphosphate synthase